MAVSGISSEQEPASGDARTLGDSDDRPVVIEASGLRKSFQIPTHRITSFKERAVHPFRAVEYRTLEALRDVSFTVGSGEFFGIVGRNGSGKSTLLKVLASVYRADAGVVRMAGRLAPFIELGVGFNPDLAARENVTLNGVMMGLTRREARKRLDAVLDFAELREFADLKLKNYSSGMSVRLAFSVMLESDADIMLIDEVLAVGDAGFQQKCMDAFADMRGAGRTMVLVTHDMSTIQKFCHRAILLDNGRIAYLGEPEEVGRRYLQLNFAAAGEGAAPAGASPDMHARVVESWLEDAGGGRVEAVEVGSPVRLNAVIEARDELRNPTFGLHCSNEAGVHVFGFNRTLTVGAGEQATVPAGGRVRLSGTIKNALAPGRYSMICWVVRDRKPGDLALQALPLANFVVYGAEATQGVVFVDSDVEAVRE